MNAARIIAITVLVAVSIYVAGQIVAVGKAISDKQAKQLEIINY